MLYRDFVAASFPKHVTLLQLQGRRVAQLIWKHIILMENANSFRHSGVVVCCLGPTAMAISSTGQSWNLRARSLLVVSSGK